MWLRALGRAIAVRAERVRESVRRRNLTWTLVTLAVLLVLVFFAPNIIINIGPGQAGVVWRRFFGGTQTVPDDGTEWVGRIDATPAGEPRSLTENINEHKEELHRRRKRPYPWGEGIHFIWPWDRMYVYDIRLQQVSHVFDVLTEDGLDVKAEITISWKPIEADLGRLHRDIGPDYVDTLLIPLVGAYAREEIARHPPDALYSPARLAMQEAIRNKTKEALLSRFYPANRRESYFIVEDVLIRSVTLPPEVATAIQEKVVQKHLAESYVYRLQRERQEAERKAIEAAGIQRFQAAINSSISNDVLRWKAIDATLELARSNNAKVVVIGSGKDGLPIILGGADTAAGTAAATATRP